MRSGSKLEAPRAVQEAAGRSTAAPRLSLSLSLALAEEMRGARILAALPAGRTSRLAAAALTHGRQLSRGITAAAAASRCLSRASPCCAEAGCCALLHAALSGSAPRIRRQPLRRLPVSPAPAFALCRAAARSAAARKTRGERSTARSSGAQARHPVKRAPDVRAAQFCRCQPSEQRSGASAATCNWHRATGVRKKSRGTSLAVKLARSCLCTPAEEDKGARGGLRGGRRERVVCLHR
jgi:hypothetical protein